MKRYREEGFPENYGLLQSNIMLRRHNDEACIKLMEKWFDELKNGSHRDQLSFNYALWKNEDVKVTYMDKNIYKSSFFKWNGAHSKVKRATQSAPLPKKKPLKVKKREHKFKKGAKIKATMNISIYAQ